jgi:hypothetical protein
MAPEVVSIQRPYLRCAMQFCFPLRTSTYGGLVLPETLMKSVMLLITVVMMPSHGALAALSKSAMLLITLVMMPSHRALAALLTSAMLLITFVMMPSHRALAALLKSAMLLITVVMMPIHRALPALLKSAMLLITVVMMPSHRALAALLKSAMIMPSHGALATLKKCVLLLITFVMMLSYRALAALLKSAMMPSQGAPATLWKSVLLLITVVMMQRCREAVYADSRDDEHSDAVSASAVSIKGADSASAEPRACCSASAGGVSFEVECRGAELGIFQAECPVSDEDGSQGCTADLQYFEPRACCSASAGGVSFEVECRGAKLAILQAECLVSDEDFAHLGFTIAGSQGRTADLQYFAACATQAPASASSELPWLPRRRRWGEKRGYDRSPNSGSTTKPSSTTEKKQTGLRGSLVRQCSTTVDDLVLSVATYEAEINNLAWLPAKDAVSVQFRVTQVDGLLYKLHTVRGSRLHL